MKSKESDELIQHGAEKYEMERHYKVPKTGKACISKSLSSSSTQTNTCDVEASDEIIIDDDIYIKDRAEYMNPHFEEDENAGDEN